MSNFFRDRRIELKMTQRQLAESLGITTSTISFWERGMTTPRPNLWERLATIYQVNLQAITEAIHEIQMKRNAA